MGVVLARYNSQKPGPPQLAERKFSNVSNA
jgi:hypothetical protein